MKRFSTMVTALVAMLLTGAIAAQACGFLVAANGAVRLEKTTTFVTWEDGIERYITNFAFSGDVESFGTIIPLPGEPTEVGRAGDWTLQRLQQEVTPQVSRLALGEVAFAAAAEDGAQVILRTQIDSLDIVVLRGGGDEVLEWVNANGFDLPVGPQTDHMLDFYASRSPYFLAARFDATAAGEDGFVSGDGIPVQITIPTERPWVPLHILHGASPDTEIIEADVFLLTPERPDLLYGEGLTVIRSEAASDLLLDDLRSDENMEWVPTDAWFTYLALETAAENVTYDLSVGVDGLGPSFVDAGFTRFEPTAPQLEAFGLEPIQPDRPIWLAIGSVAIALIGGATGGWLVMLRRSVRRSPMDRLSTATDSRVSDASLISH